jgi:hypothetical protein
MTRTVPTSYYATSKACSDGRKMGTLHMREKRRFKRDASN